MIYLRNGTSGEKQECRKKSGKKGDMKKLNS